MEHQLKATLEKLPPKKGAYHYFEIPATIVESIGTKNELNS